MKAKHINGYSQDIEKRKKQITSQAFSFGWKLKDFQSGNGTLIFQKFIENKRNQINVFITTLSVATYLDHPKTGKNQLYRKGLDKRTMRKIFENPRYHTSLGYRKK